MNLRNEFEKDCVSLGYDVDKYTYGDYKLMHIQLSWIFYQLGFNLGAKPINSDDVPPYIED